MLALTRLRLPRPCSLPSQSSSGPTIHISRDVCSLPGFVREARRFGIRCESDSASSTGFGALSKVNLSDTSRISGEMQGTAKGTNSKNRTSIVWFRNDLRVHDNEALRKAFESSDTVLPLYCFDPRHFGKTTTFGFPKTGELRAQFLLESVENLRQNLQSIGSNLVIRHGYPEKIIPEMSKSLHVTKVYAQKETCSEELQVERAVTKALNQLSDERSIGNSTGTRFREDIDLIFVWGTTLYHLEDIPFSPSTVPDVYTQFRKKVELNSNVREPITIPKTYGKFPENIVEQIQGTGSLPSLPDLGLQYRAQDPKGVMHFKGGEASALARLNDYFWKKDLLRVYKETRNGMLGADYSTKFSPWLALGCISPRYIYNQVMKYEKDREANESTYWVLFELIWRDYFRYISMKYGNSIFHLGGPRNVKGVNWNIDWNLFNIWKTGQTGYPLIDANMRELYETGFMSNRGRQIVCSFLVRDMGVDWRMGAEWFETMLLDYDPCSNYGNWTYGAGVGNDPREDRYFSIPKQASSYDPEGEYVSHWIPQLSKLPPKLRHFPYQLSPSEKSLYGLSVPGLDSDAAASYPNPIVPLKFGQKSFGGESTNKRGGGNSSGGRGGSRFGAKGRGRSGQSAKF